VAPIPNPAESNSDELSPLDCFPSDVAIVSISDARRRLTLADGFRNDLTHIMDELKRLQMQALASVDMFDVDVLSDPKRMRSLLAQMPVPASWGDEWVIELIYAGEFCAHGLWFQELGRVAAFAGIPKAEVTEVIRVIDEAIEAAIGEVRISELFPQTQDVIEQLSAAGGQYQILRDAIAGRLDRMQIEQAGGDNSRVDPRAVVKRPGSDDVATQQQVEQSLDALNGINVPGAPPPADPTDAADVPTTRIVRHDRPEGFSEERWEELASLKLLLESANRFLNQVNCRGGRSTSLLANCEEIEILNQLQLFPGNATIRLHHKARDLAGNLHRDCSGIDFQSCPPLASCIPDGHPDQVRIAVRDTVPALREWVRHVEVAVRAWAKANTRKSNEDGTKSVESGKKALEDRIDIESIRLVSLYDSIVSSRRPKEGPFRRAERLSLDKDLVEASRQAGEDKGITETLVKRADQFVRDREQRRVDRESQVQK
jgi:hypothetical protein